MQVEIFINLGPIGELIMICFIGLFRTNSTVLPVEIADVLCIFTLTTELYSNSIFEYTF